MTKTIRSGDFPTRQVPQAVDDKVFAHIFSEHKKRRSVITFRNVKYFGVSLVAVAILLFSLFAVSPSTVEESDGGMIAVTTGSDNFVVVVDGALDTDSIDETIDVIDEYLLALDTDGLREFDEL